MLGASRRVLVVMTVVAAALIVGDASARTIRRSCRDGTSAPRAEGSGQPLVTCDVGATCDGACAFELPLCGPESCQVETFNVPAGRTRRERLVVSPGAVPSTLVLRCRPATRRAACIVVTTTTVTTTSGSSTTGGPGGPSGPTTTTRVRLVNPSTTSSTTSSTFPIPTTTIPVIPSQIPCLGDRNCDGLATACAVGFCANDGFCAQACFCLTTNRGPTCSLDAARPCLTPDDCLDADGPDPTCHVCYLNRCTIALAPECFPVLPVQSPAFTTNPGAGFTVGGVQMSTP
jgi:hypothetical protein